MCIKFEFDVYRLLSFDRRILDTQPIDTGSLTFECVCTLAVNLVFRENYEDRRETRAEVGTTATAATNGLFFRPQGFVRKPRSRFKYSTGRPAHTVDSCIAIFSLPYLTTTRFISDHQHTDTAER